MSIKSYQNLKSELDDIIQKLENNNVDIDEAGKLYEEGIKLLKQIEQYLKGAEAKIKKIK